MIYAITAAIGSLWLLFVFFLAVMSLQSARDRGTLTLWGLRFGMTALVVGYLIDAAVQFTVASFLWMELPKELTVSKRVKRLINEGSGWRKTLAEWFRDHLLKPFDVTGKHG